MPSVLWFRRDLRLGDNPALLDAATGPHGSGTSVVPLFVVDPALWGPSGEPRRAYLAASLRSLDEKLGGTLTVLLGDPVEVVPALARAVGARAVHAAADFGPYGASRDASVGRALDDDGRALVRTGSPYAVAPGTVRKDDGTPYRVFTPFHRAWLARGWRTPARAATPPRWVAGDVDAGRGREARRLLDATRADGVRAGEDVALARWRAYVGAGLAGYDVERDRPDHDATSRLSVALRWGELHPRTLLADLDGTTGASAFRRQLCWREFYADVLHHAPASARSSLHPGAEVAVDAGPDADDRFEAWCAGRTGYPYVDAGMRQLAAEGWMHNRARMVTASFLVKDLHLPWQRGARWFMRRLADGDLANNQHGWQWVAGTGTDAAPYVRVFNPVTQGLRFDPDGDYVRRWVPELRGLPGAAAHEPWKSGDGAPTGYPQRIVEHDKERRDSLARWSTR